MDTKESKRGNKYSSKEDKDIINKRPSRGFSAAESKLVMTSGNNLEFIILPVTEPRPDRLNDLPVPDYIEERISLQVRATVRARVEERDQVRLARDGIKFVCRLESARQGICAKAGAKESSGATRVGVAVVMDDFCVKITTRGTRSSPEICRLGPADTGRRTCGICLEATVLDEGFAPIATRVCDFEIALTEVNGGRFVCDKIVLLRISGGYLSVDP